MRIYIFDRPQIIRLTLQELFIADCQVLQQQPPCGTPEGQKCECRNFNMNAGGPNQFSSPLYPMEYPREIECSFTIEGIQ